MSVAVGRAGERRKLSRFPADWKPLDLAGKRALVLGLGSFGGQLGSVRHLCRAGAQVTVTDLLSHGALKDSIAELEGLPIRYVLGENRVEDLRGADFVVASPAVPWSTPMLAEASRLGIPVETEITLLFRLLTCPVIGITGTNGKSTTTRLVGHLLAQAGRKVRVGGNVGGSLLPEVESIRAEEVVVLELSSFQLEHLGEVGLGPSIALVTNVTPDHLDRHGTLDAYVDAKRRILTRADVAVLNQDDEVCRGFAGGFQGRIRWYGTAAGESFPEPRAESCWLQEGRFALRPGAKKSGGASCEPFDLSGMVLKGSHNRLNLIAAALAAECFGAPFEDALRSGLGVHPLPQRLAELAVVREVRFIDDSVSTSPPAVVAALSSFDAGILLLAGGCDKGIDPTPMLSKALHRCRRVYLYGAVGAALAAQLEQLRRSSPVEPRQGDAAFATWDVFGTLDLAFERAAEEARAGEVVLLSPGFASYDQFRNFRHRGERYGQLVRHHAECSASRQLEAAALRRDS